MTTWQLKSHCGPSKNRSRDSPASKHPAYVVSLPTMTCLSFGFVEAASDRQGSRRSHQLLVSTLLIR